MNTETPQYVIFDHVESLIQALTDTITTLAAQAQASHSQFNLALAGGTTPGILYQHLAGVDSIDWQSVSLFFGDERFVPLDDERSNYRMVKTTLLDRIDVSHDTVFPVNTNLKDASAAAQDYSNTIRQRVTSVIGDVPSLDLVLLGVGEDGHTASLFPDSDSLNNHTDLVLATRHPQLDEARVSFGLKLINNAQHVFVLATGKSKREVISEIMQRRPDQAAIYPVELVRGRESTVYYLDAEATTSRDP